MDDLAARRNLKAQLPRTWGAFFERYGNFTPAQVSAIPLILDGQNVVLSARTASGKTEAAVVPLIEKNLFEEGLHLLYITPTRALASDLYGRLAHPLDVLKISLAVKTYDLTTFDPKRPAQVLITTPEAADSLLANHARIFVPLKAIILDELHLFDGTVRGDQLRVVLKRIQQIKTYAFTQAETESDHLQFVGLSATMVDPVVTAARYFPNPIVISLSEKRQISCDMLPMAADSTDVLRDYLYTFREKGWKKALVFCNTRAEIERYAGAIFPKSPFGNAVYVHYSNIAPKRRREIEERFAKDESAICFASSTLELGIDIGSIDAVSMIGAPGNVASFMQRIGRGNRRKKTIQIACFYRSLFEELLFRVLLDDTEIDINSGNFRPSVAIQQIFSLIKQSPQGAVRVNSIAPLFHGLLSPKDIEFIIGQLVNLQFLQQGKPGEWKADERLNHLIDEQNSTQAKVSIHSNITGGAGTIAIRNQHTDEVVANVGGSWLRRDEITLEGRAFNVHWHDKETAWVVGGNSAGQSKDAVFVSSRQLLSYNLAHRIPLHINLVAGEMFLAQAGEQWYLFHWLGDLYGAIFTGLLRRKYHVEGTTHPGVYLQLSEPIPALSVWSDTQISNSITEQYRSLEPLLSLGLFHRYLPDHLRLRAVLDQIDIPHVSRVLNSLKLVTDIDRVAIDPIELLVPFQ